MGEKLSWGMILVGMAQQFLPVWIALVVTYALSIRYKRRLGLYGKLFDSPVGMIGFGIVMFWVFTAIFADLIITHDPLGQLSGQKNAVPGSPLKAPKEGEYLHYLPKMVDSYKGWRDGLRAWWRQWREPRRKREARA